jgi:hypothetical protein
VTELVKSCVLLFEKVPVALNCTVVPVATEPFAGVTAIDTSVAAVTLRPVDPVMEPCLAEIVVDCPEVTPVACPAALMVAAVAFDELQVTELVKSCVLLFENVPVAVNCAVVPVATEPFAGVTAIDTSVAAVTLRPVDPVMEPCLAEIVVDCPEVTPVASPAALMVAAVAFDELQVTEPVKSCVLLSENVAVALNCVVTPGLSEELAGVTAIAASVAPVTDTSTFAVSEPEEAWIAASPKPAPVAKPVGLIATTAELEDVQVAVVNDSVPPLASFPVAEKRTVSPFGIVPKEGETEIDTN